MYILPKKKRKKKEGYFLFRMNYGHLDQHLPHMIFSQ